MTTTSATTNHILAARAFARPFTNFAAAVATTAALGLATFAFAMPAHAEEALPSVRISYADLDLGSEQGRATLRHRVAGAVRQVCEEEANISDPLKARIAYDRCHAEVSEASGKRLATVLSQRKLAAR